MTLLGEADAIALGIVTLDLKGSEEANSAAVPVRKIEYGKLEENTPGEVVSGGQTQS